MKQINNICEWQKKNEIPLFGGKRSCLKRIRGYDTLEEGGGSKYSFVADKVLSYF